MLVLYAGFAEAGLDIYIVRHAQTVSNATGVKDKRSDSTFSEEGAIQIERLTGELLRLNFDAVLVSPTERTLRTVFPYLKKSGRNAIVWPEVTECCWQEARMEGEAGQLLTSGVLQLPSDIAPQFSFRDASSAFKYANRNYADGVAQIRQAVSLLRANYSGKSVLIVTHHHAGGVLMSQLLGVARDSLPGLENARLTHLRELPDGRFKLLTINE
jgi:broad specificity phosphatase PhoE